MITHEWFSQQIETGLLWGIGFWSAKFLLDMAIGIWKGILS